MFYYKFNLKLPNYKWTGSKACRMKNLKSPQWLRNIKDKKFGFYRIDTFFSETKYRNLLIIDNGGWHYTNIKTAEEILHKLKSYLHHQEFDENPLSLEQIENIIQNKTAIYNLGVDQRQNKFGSGPKLTKIEKNVSFFKNLTRWRPIWPPRNHTCMSKLKNMSKMAPEKIVDTSGFQKTPKMPPEKIV